MSRSVIPVQWQTITIHRVSRPIMKFNIKVARMDRRSFLARTAGFPLFLGLSRKSQDRDFDVL